MLKEDLFDYLLIIIIIDRIAYVRSIFVPTRLRLEEI